MTSSSAHGLKHTCAECACRFFDLNKTPPTCPKCKCVVVPVVVKKYVRPGRRNTENSGAAIPAPVATALAVTKPTKPVKLKR